MVIFHVSTFILHLHVGRWRSFCCLIVRFGSGPVSSPGSGASDAIRGSALPADLRIPRNKPASPESCSWCTLLPGHCCGPGLCAPDPWSSRSRVCRPHSGADRRNSCGIYALYRDQAIWMTFSIRSLAFTFGLW